MYSKRSRPHILLLAIALLASLIVASPQTAVAQDDDFDTAEPAIINGSPVAAGEMPHLGRLIIDERFGCAGSLIAPTWVLTAAHCVTQSNGSAYPASALVMGFGNIDWPFATQIIAGKSVTVHPQYDRVNLLDDIALIELSSPVNLRDPGAGLIALNESSRPTFGETVVVAGWGATNPITGGSSSDLALKAAVPTSNCNGAPFDNVNTSQGPLQVSNQTEICTAPPSPQGSCSGDSGGPLIQKQDGRTVLVGTVSGGVTSGPLRCGVGTVYQRVSAFVPWIKSTTGEPFLECGGLPVEHFVTPGVPFTGTAGPDVIMGTDGDDVINGLGGDDVICAKDGRDIVRAGAGNDVVFGGFGVDKIYGSTGRDELHGEGGSDRIWGQGAADTIMGGSGADRIWGGDANDTITGMGGKDTIYGEAGDDTIQGNSQSDVIFGGTGNDILRGADGKDKIYGGRGNDQMFGGKNTDFLTGQDGNDLANGQQGKDNPLVANVSGCVAETKISC